MRDRPGRGPEGRQSIYGDGKTAITAGIDFVLGFIWGLILIPIGVKVVAPVWTAVMPKGV